jgi:hypothetical protein
MVRYPCKGTLNVIVEPDEVDENKYMVIAALRHNCQHPSYVFTSTPKEAIEEMKKMLDYSPTEVAGKLRKKWSWLRQKQIYRLWSQLCEASWRRDANPMESAKCLIHEDTSVDLWDLQVPEGVVALAWGMKRISERIGKEIVEIGIDATCTWDNSSRGSTNPHWQITQIRENWSYIQCSENMTMRDIR